MKKEMLINVLQPEECRIAMLEDGVLEELYVERTSHESYVGNIYKGRIVNIEPSIQAAFVDFGVGRNGFLHVSDVEPAYYRHLQPGGGGRDSGRGERGDRDERRGDRGGRGERGGRGDRRPPPRGFDEDRPRPQPSPRDFDDDMLPLPYSTDEVEVVNEFEVEEIVREPEQEAEAAEAPPDEPGAEAEAPAPPRSSRRRPAPAEAESPAEAEPPAESAEAEAPKGRRRGTRGRSRRPRADEEQAGGAAQEPAPPKDEPDRPRLMDSAEHRTDEGRGAPGPLGAPDPFDDADLSFSQARPRPAPESRPAPPLPPVYTTEPPEPDFDDQPRGSDSRDELRGMDLDDDLPPVDFDEDDEEGAPSLPEARDDDDYAERLPGEGRPEFDDIDIDEPPRPHGRGGRDDRRGGPRGRDDRRGGPRGRDDRRGGPRGRGGFGRPGGRPKPLIQDIFRRGQEVLVQVIKEGIGTKGPTLSTYISIAGRYLVLMPGLNRIGVSRKIEDEEQRRRLRDILGELKPPKGLGFIIRTAGLDRTKKELQRDLAYLSRLWQVVVRRIRKVKAPTEVYQESDMITRTIRDCFTGEIDTIWVDEPAAYERAREFLEYVMPRYASRIKLYDHTDPMFHRHGIEDEITRIQQRHVPLPNGGSIVIDQTEALVAIDVNSGNFRADNNAEETAYQMNLLAAREIARQLRLRDLGGVIVNDFIDMKDEKHRRGVERAMREAVQRDRARTKILKISQFGIIEMTRQRIRPSLKRSVYQDCPHCGSTGQVKTVESMSIEVMRLLQLAAHKERVQRIQVRVHDEVGNYVQNRKRKEVAKLEESAGIQVTVVGAGAVSPEFLEFLCYDNNDSETRFMPYEETKPRRRGRGRD